MTTLDPNAPLIPEPALRRYLGISTETLRATGVQPAETTPTGRQLHSIATAERVAAKLTEQNI